MTTRLLFAILLLSSHSQAQQTRRTARGLPNIVYILADDLGYGDLSVYQPGGRIRTPHIDRLAAEGMRFTDAHSPSGVCTPTRYSILTGRYPWRSRLPVGVLKGYSRPLIEADRPTVASLLASRGYHTAVVGKWHLGLGWTPHSQHAESLRRPLYGISDEMPPAQVDVSAAITEGPNTVGFGYSYVLPASLDMPPYAYVRNHRLTEPLTGHTTLHKPDTGYAGAFWRAGRMAPSFDFHQVLPAFFREAEDFIRAQNSSTPFFLYLPLPAPHTPWMPVDPWRGGSSAGEYGDFVQQLDASVGRLMATLDSMGMRDNTIVVFTSDNGPYWRSDYISKYDHRSAGPFRGMKGDAFEGGHRVPFIVRWPGHVAPGTVSAATTTLANLMATVADITETHNRKYAVEDSYSILPVLTGKVDRVQGQPAVVHHSSAGMFALRLGDWKLIDGLGSGGFTVPRFVKQQPGGPAVQLFNLRDDPGETKDLAGEHPDKVAELKAMLERIRSARVRVSD